MTRNIQKIIRDVMRKAPLYNVDFKPSWQQTVEEQRFEIEQIK